MKLGTFIKQAVETLEERGVYDEVTISVYVDAYGNISSPSFGNELTFTVDVQEFRRREANRDRGME